MFLGSDSLFMDNKNLSYWVNQDQTGFYGFSHVARAFLRLSGLVPLAATQSPRCSRLCMPPRSATQGTQ
jgi:hypothetical protein